MGSKGLRQWGTIEWRPCAPAGRRAHQLEHGSVSADYAERKVPLALPVFPSHSPLTTHQASAGRERSNQLFGLRRGAALAPLARSPNHQGLLGLAWLPLLARAGAAHGARVGSEALVAERLALGRCPLLTSEPKASQMTLVATREVMSALS